MRGKKYGLAGLTVNNEAIMLMYGISGEAQTYKDKFVYFIGHFDYQGTYRVEPSAQEVGDCPSCPPGKYCGETGLSTPSGDCAAGHYCIGGADTSHPYITECVSQAWSRIQN